MGWREVVLVLDACITFVIPRPERTFIPRASGWNLKVRLQTTWFRCWSSFVQPVA